MDYKVGLVAGIIGGKNKPVAQGKLADLFSSKKPAIALTPVSKIQDSETSTAEKPAKKRKVVKKKIQDSIKHQLKKQKIPVQAQTQGFSPPPGIVHEALTATASKQLPGNKRKKSAAAEDSEDEAESPKAKRPRRDRLKKATEKRTVFVGNMPLCCDKKKLRRLFKRFGEVESVRFRCAPVADPSIPKRVSAITKDFHDQRHNISAYVCFKEEESAKDALSLNGHVLDGLHIRVDSAASSKQHDNSRSVFVGNLPFTIEEEVVRSHFEDCGDIENVRIIRDRKTNLGKGFCYILFKSKDSVSLAMKLQNSTLEGRQLRIQKCSEQGALQSKKKKSSLKNSTQSNLKNSSAGALKTKHQNSSGVLKTKHRSKFWQPTNTSSFTGLKSTKDKKLKKKLKLKKKKRKVDEVSKVLGPADQSVGLIKARGKMKAGKGKERKKGKMNGKFKGRNRKS